MGKTIVTIALYFGIVFGAGFVLGPIRVLWLEPWLGALASVAIEVPLLLIVMAIAARWVPTRMGIGDRGTLTAMGAGALVLVLVADFVVGAGLRGLSFGQQIRQFSTPAGLLYAANLAAFAAMPLLVNRARRGG